MMKIAICDDEQNCINDVRTHISFFSKDVGVELEQYTFNSAEELMLSNLKFDIAVLDVEMEGTDGIKLGEYLRTVNPHIILIYVTAHRKYLDDALNLNAVRFFEKPIDPQRFYRGLKDAIDRIDNSNISFYLKDGKTIEKISAKDIIYIEIENRKTKVVNVDKIYHASEHISFWKDKLSGTIFVVPHKSYIVNLNFVTTYQRESIVLDNCHTIPVARNKQSDFYRHFMKFMEGK